MAVLLDTIVKLIIFLLLRVNLILLKIDIIFVHKQY